MLKDAVDEALAEADEALALQQFGNSMSEMDTYRRFLIVQLVLQTRKCGASHTQSQSTLTHFAFGHWLRG